MRDLIISDTQFGNHKQFADYSTGLNSRLLHQLIAFDRCLEEAAEQGCKRVIHLGDVFEKNNILEPEIVNSLLKTLKKYEHEFSEFIFLTGNHDKTGDMEEFNKLLILDGQLGKKVRIISKPYLSARDVTEIFIPYMKDEERVEQVIEKTLNPSKNVGYTKKHTVLYLHQTIIESEHGRMFIKGVNPEYLKQFKQVYCGHIHQSQKVRENVLIVGAPYPITFGDSNDRFVVIVENGKPIKRFKPAHPKFIKTDNVDDVPKNDKYNFYMLTTDKPVPEMSANVRVAKRVEVHSVVRIKAKSDKELLKAYCKKMNVSGFTLSLGTYLLHRAETLQTKEPQILDKTLREIGKLCQ